MSVNKKIKMRNQKSHFNENRNDDNGKKTC